MVQPPEGWTPPDASGEPAGSAASTGSAVDVSAAAAASSAVAPTPTSQPTPSPPTPLHSSPLAPTTSAEAATLRERWAGSAAATPPLAGSPSVPSAVNDVPLRGEDWLSPRRRWLRHYLPQIGAALVGVIVTSAVWYAFSPGKPPEESVSATAPEEPREKPPNDAANADIPVEPTLPPERAAATPAPRAPEPDEVAGANPAVVPTVATPDAPRVVQSPPAADPVDVAENDAAPEKPVRDPLPVVDVPARLNDTILKLDYVNAPLVDFLGVLSNFSTIPITLDVDAVVESGIRVDAPVTVRRPKSTVGQALDAALAPLKLRYVVADQHVLVTVAEPEAPPPPVRRDVGDLIGGEAGGPDRLARLVMRLVEPTSWQAERTTTSLRVDGSALVIVQSPRVVRKIDALLAALRAARRDPVGAAVAPPPALETRPAMARDALGKKITLNYTTPTPMAKILSRLAESSKLTLVVDWQALAAESLGPASTTSLIANDVTVERALAAFVEPLSLAVRVIDARTVEITTQDELAGKPELAAFPLADLAGDPQSLAAIGDKLRQQFGPAVSLDAADGDADFGVAWHLDAPSKTLFIRAPQDSLVRLDGVFRDARAKQKR